MNTNTLKRWNSGSVSNEGATKEHSCHRDFLQISAQRSCFAKALVAITSYYSAGMGQKQYTCRRLYCTRPGKDELLKNGKNDL